MSVVLVAVTAVLGFGITQLEFATGQDSYLNSDEQVYKDTVAYQDLFGGQAMLSLVTMDEGHTVNELFTPENLAVWETVEAELRDSGAVRVASSARAPRSQFTDALVAPSKPDGTVNTSPERRSPRASPPGSSSAPATPERNTAPDGTVDEASIDARRASSLDDRRPHLGDPRRPACPRRTRRGSTSCCTTTRARSARRSARSSPTSDHAQMVVRLPGNQDIETEGEAAAARRGRHRAARASRTPTTTTTGAPVLLKRHQRLPHGRDAHPRRRSPSRSWS